MTSVWMEPRAGHVHREKPDGKRLTIDLRSDTMSAPTDAMFAATRNAGMGDEAWATDSGVADLEARCAELFGKEAAIYTGSGTMGNQLAIASQLEPGDELITERCYHVNYFESAATVVNSLAVLNPISTRDGIIRRDDLQDAIQAKPRGANYAYPKLLSLENTVGTIGGNIYPFNELERVSQYAHEMGMSVHIDGARLANAIVATGRSAQEYGSVADTISMCFSKGLSAPYGGILVGDRDTIRKARRRRKWMGGSLHQASYTAAAAEESLNNFDQIRADNKNAMAFYEELENTNSSNFIVAAPPTNIVLLKFPANPDFVDEFVRSSSALGVLLSKWQPGVARAVLHRGVSHADAKVAGRRVNEIVKGWT